MKQKQKSPIAQKQQLKLLHARIAFLILSAVMLMSCGKKFDTGSQESVVVPGVSEKYTALTFEFGSMPGSTTYNYSYKVDFLAMTIKVQTSVTGTTNVTLPTPGTRSLKSEQLAQIKALINNLSYQSCMEGPEVLGGSSETLSLYTSSLSEADTRITSQCRGSKSLSSHGAIGGFQELVTYLQTL